MHVSEEEWEAGEKYRVPFEEKPNIVVKPEPKEELYKWYPIVDEGEYWLDDEINPKVDPESMKRIYKDNIVTIITNGEFLFDHSTSRIGWGTMAKQGGWKYMRIKIC